MIEIILTREDANSESALITEWSVGDREPVRKGQQVCVVETTKAAVEITAPGDGTLVHLHEVGAEVEMGARIAVIAETEAEIEGAAATRAPAVVAAAERSGGGRVTRKAAELAERHGIDLDAIDKRGFVTEDDVRALLASQDGDGADPLLAGISLDGVSLPASYGADPDAGRLDEAFVERLRTDPESVRGLPADEKIAAYREHGAIVGEGVTLGDGALVAAPRVILADGCGIGAGGSLTAADMVAVGEGTQFGPGLELACRQAHIGRGVWAGRAIRFGGGGHRDPWALLTVGDHAFIGDEVFVNVARPVLIGARVFLTMRAMIVTHNIGHSLLAGYENRFAPVVLEDWSQVGLGAVVYAGCRVGSRAIVASNSYVVSDIPAGRLAIGVPARAAGAVQRSLSRGQQAALARGMVDDLAELLDTRGHPVRRIDDGFEVEVGTVRFTERLEDPAELPDGDGERVVLTFEYGGADPPPGTAVLDLLGERLWGEDGVLLDSVREFCRKRGIRFTDRPWRYRGGLI